MKISTAALSAKSNARKLLDFFESHPDEVFLSTEIEEKTKLFVRVRDLVPRDYKCLVGSKVWYGMPSAISKFKVELQRRK